MRAEFTKKVRLDAFQRAGGACEGCSARLAPGNVHYDHRLPVALGGSSDVDNCAPLCRACHGAKTAGEDIPQIRKADRQKAAHLGAKKRKGRPMDGSRDSRWKKKMDGRVVRR